MRAAIAKRFSGDAAPERLRFFRISVGLGLAGRVLVRGATAPRLYQDKHTPRSHSPK